MLKLLSHPISEVLIFQRSESYHIQRSINTVIYCWNDSNLISEGLNLKIFWHKLPNPTHQQDKVSTLWLPSFISYLKGPYICNLPWAPWILLAGLYKSLVPCIKKSLVTTGQKCGHHSDSTFCTMRLVWLNVQQCIHL